ncbi:MAG TPA: hypothetical protein VLB50_06600, partial [Ignavibacteriaceae bacterium]|nr:hypothetical protein [Ignavibacteriaceae bacterium]
MFAEKKNILSEEFVHKIVEYSAGYFDEVQLKSLFSLIETEAQRHFFNDTSAINLLRVIDAAYDKISFLSDCLKYPHYIELLIAITSNSNYLTDILVRNPEYFYLIANPSRLEVTLNEENYTQLVSSSTEMFRSFDAKLNGLRRFKRKEILRIGAKDIFLKKNVEEITAELSSLAKAIASHLFSLCYRKISEKYLLELKENKYCVVSLGKLGGKELNYSSDIDLIVFYDTNDSFVVKKDYQEILNETILLFIESASRLTSEGYLYRIDFRLRPQGQNSLLCKRLIDYLKYYELRGEAWERQMLIKSDFVGGSKQLFEEFRNYLTPFIFPLSFNSSPLEQIKRLKLNIEKNLKDRENIKLTPGGIRDIEFSIQALQLLNGGKIKSLRIGNTLQAISELLNQGLLVKDESDTLKEAYIFYRKIEHYMQLMNDTQTHNIPSSGEILDKLSYFLGYAKPVMFLKSVGYYFRKVAKIYESVIGMEKQKNIKRPEINFASPQSAGKDLEYLKEGRGLLGQKEFDQHSIEAFNKIYESLSDYLGTALNPDLVLKNFVRVIRQAKFPSIWYDEFRNEDFFKLFLTLCEFSQTSIDIFSEDKKLRELFLSKSVFQNTDYETLQYDELIFILSLQLTLGIVKPENFSGILSKFFLNRIKDLSVNLDKNKIISGQYFIGAMGSLGNGEMTFASDIDLIFVTGNPKVYFEQQNIFVDFLGILRTEFKPIKVDCRLRPEGKSGMLVWDISSYINYIHTRARTWELQSFTKLNFISGNKRLFDKIINAVSGRLKSIDSVKLKTDFLEMRRKLSPVEGIPGLINLKKARGGIMDIEFILQYLVLCNPKIFQKFRAKNNRTVLTGLVSLNPELKESLEKILFSYEFLKS